MNKVVVFRLHSTIELQESHNNVDYAFHMRLRQFGMAQVLEKL